MSYSRFALGLAWCCIWALSSGCDKPSSSQGQSSSGSSLANGPLQVGDPAPEVVFSLQDGKQISLSSLRGKEVLVYFYPKDDTPGCTAQAKGIRDAWSEFQAAGVEVYGVSTQDAASHQAFRDKYELPFSLVVDKDAAVAAKFRVPTTVGFARRQSFLIGKDGAIKRVWLDVDPSLHASNVLQAR